MEFASENYLPNIEDVKEPEPSPWIFLLGLILSMIIGNLLGSGLIFLYSRLAGMDLMTLLASGNLDTVYQRNFFRWVNLIGHISTFLIPSLVVLILLSRKTWVSQLKMAEVPYLRQLVLGIIFILLTFPLAQVSYWVNQQIPLPDWARDIEDAAAKTLESLLKMEHPGELIFNLFVIAVFPAIGEEFVFRGIIQKQFERIFKKGWMAIWLTAFIFSAFHLQFEGFFARMILGAGLGYLFYWTKNLWVPILAHLVINGTQLVVYYFNGKEIEELPDDLLVQYWPVMVVSGIFLFLTGKQLKKLNPENRVSQNDQS